MRNLGRVSVVMGSHLGVFKLGDLKSLQVSKLRELRHSYEVKCESPGAPLCHPAQNQGVECDAGEPTSSSAAAASSSKAPRASPMSMLAYVGTWVIRRSRGSRPRGEANVGSLRTCLCSPTTQAAPAGGSGGRLESRLRRSPRGRGPKAPYGTDTEARDGPRAHELFHVTVDQVVTLRHDDPHVHGALGRPGAELGQDRPGHEDEEIRARVVAVDGLAADRVAGDGSIGASHRRQVRPRDAERHGAPVMPVGAWATDSLAVSPRLGVSLESSRGAVLRGLTTGGARWVPLDVIVSRPRPSDDGERVF